MTRNATDDFTSSILIAQTSPFPVPVRIYSKEELEEMSSDEEEEYQRKKADFSREYAKQRAVSRALSSRIPTANPFLTLPISTLRPNKTTKESFSANARAEIIKKVQTSPSR